VWEKAPGPSWCPSAVLLRTPSKNDVVIRRRRVLAEAVVENPSWPGYESITYDINKISFCSQFPAPAADRTIDTLKIFPTTPPPGKLAAKLPRHFVTAVREKNPDGTTTTRVSPPAWATESLEA